MTPEVSRSPLVGVVMGSKSDWETMRHAVEVLTELGVPVESKVVSAHRTPQRLFQYGRDAEGRGLEVIVAGAGGAAHLPGMLAAISILPVLGVPVQSKSLKGVDSLLSIVQMPRGVPVGTLAIGTSGAVNAGLLAAAILARKYPAVREALRASARLKPRPWESRRYELQPRRQRESGRRSDRARAGSSGSQSTGIAGRHRQRAIGTDVRPGRAADGLPGGRPEHHRGRTRRPGGPMEGDRRCRSPSGACAVAAAAEAVTVEFENVSAPALRWLARRRIVRPGWRTVWISQNRLREKSFLASNAIPHAPWRPVRTEVEIAPAVQTLGLPLILKTASSGYDGKGQVLVTQAAEAAAAWASLGRVACVAEGWVEFAAEVSVVVARGQDGNAVAYPVGLNHHERHILDTTMMPAPVGPIVALEARTLALAVAQALGTVGVLCVEFFLTQGGRLLVNEIAPRPHNSGHLTLEAATVCQFEQQVRALCGLPLGRSDLIMPAAMVNFLGDLWASGEPRWGSALRLDPDVKIHLYGKRTPAAGRKMGHLTVLDPDPQSALARALAARQALEGGRR